MDKWINDNIETINADNSVLKIGSLFVNLFKKKKL